MGNVHFECICIFPRCVINVLCSGCYFGDLLGRVSTSGIVSVHTMTPVTMGTCLAATGWNVSGGEATSRANG